MTDRPDHFELAQKVFAERFADAHCAFVAGSVIRGEHTATSDIDMIVIYADEDSPSYRDSQLIEGWPFEFFVHNLPASEYFFQKDVKRGSCATMTMVRDGIVIPEETAISNALKDHARKLIDAGPEKLDENAIDMRRYGITDLLDDIAAPRNDEEVQASLNLLYERLGDFYLRANGCWSGFGKMLPRLIRRRDAELADDFTAAFAANDIDAIQALADRILEPHGGRLWAGFTLQAPDDIADTAPAISPDII